MSRLFLLSLFTCGLFSLPAAAQQTGKITGKVFSGNNEPTSFATVILYDAAKGEMAKANSTEDDGSFELINVASGRYVLEVTYVGFDKYASDTFQYNAPNTLQLANITLRTASTELKEVQIVSTRPIVEVQPDKTVFNVQGSINATGNTALELLRKSPGVIVDNNDNIILAGKTGVRVYIDGKQSPLAGDDLANYLKNMQSSEIDAIEIITNPSARYDAEGNAGIINIRLVKDKSLGANGNVNLGYRYGQRPKYNASTNFNYRNKSSNIFGSYSHFNGYHVNGMFFNRELQGVRYAQTNDMLGRNISHNFKLGTDFFVSKKSTIGFLVSGNISDNENQSKTFTDIGPIGEGTVESILVASSDMVGDRNNWNFNINYAFRGNDKSTWNIDADHGRFRNFNETYQPNIYTDPLTGLPTSERIFSLVTPTDIDIYTFKFDHARPLGKGQFGAGAKFSLVNTDNTFNFFDIIDSDRLLNKDRSNNFVFEENINAGYASYQRQLGKKWNLMTGLRVENTQSTGTLTSESPSDNDIVKRSYTDFFPSAGLTYMVNPKNSLRVNYSRRIDRPSYQDLNPFEWKLDELSFRKGNAFLTPQYANSYSLTHTYNYKLNTSLSFTQINDVFTQITEALDDTISILTFVNLAKQTNFALTVSYPFEVKKWWSVYANTTAYRLHNSANIDGNEIDLTAYVFNIYAQNTFLLPKGLKMELSGWYNSPGIWQGNWTTDAMYAIDAGVQKTIFDDAATLKVSVSDIFFTQQWGGESEFGPLRISGGGFWESRQVRVNFTYLFGNRQVKGARQRRTGMEDEQRRIGSEN